MGKNLKNAFSSIIKKIKGSKILALLILGVVALLIAVLVFISLKFVKDHTVERNDSSTADSLSTYTTEEEDAITKKILENDVEITIDGYQQIEGEDGLNDVVIISVKNISNEKTNFNFSVVALDENDKVIDKTSLYAEGIEPGQVQVFHAFALSYLTPDQLKQAHYKIYKAKTYELEPEQTTESKQDIEPEQTVELEQNTEPEQ